MLLAMNPHKPCVHPLLCQHVGLVITLAVFLPESDKPMRWYCRMAMLLSMNSYKLFVHPLLHQKVTLAIASAVCLPGSNEPMWWYHHMAMLLSMNPHEPFVHPLPLQNAGLMIASAVCLPESSEPMRWYRHMAMLPSMNPHKPFVPPPRPLKMLPLQCYRQFTTLILMSPCIISSHTYVSIMSPYELFVCTLSHQKGLLTMLSAVFILSLSKAMHYYLHGSIRIYGPHTLTGPQVLYWL